VDWQFKVGLGITLIFGLLQFVVKAVPSTIAWPGIATGVLFILWGLLPHHDKIPYFQVFIFMTLIAGATATAAWIAQSYSSSAKGDAHVPSPSLDYKVQLDCMPGVLPKTIPQDGFMLVTISGTGDNPGSGQSFYSPSIEWNWDNMAPRYVTHCTLSNFSNALLMNVSIEFEIEILPKTTKNKDNSQVPINRTTIEVPIPRRMLLPD
jgi:hypothetical protein